MRFRDAIEYFKSIGLDVEPGPRHNETTLINKGIDFVGTHVVPNNKLAGMAEVSRDMRSLRLFVSKAEVVA